jgi:heat shock protein HslJ
MKILITFVLIALLAASCGGDGLPDEAGDVASTTSPDDQPDTAATVTPTNAASDLNVVPAGSPAGDWQLVEGVDLVDGFPITMSIDGAVISGRAACNSYGGTITVDGSAVSFGEFSWTEMGCEQPVMEAEQLFLAALLAAETFALDGDRLTLTGPDGDLVFEPVVPTPTAELIDTNWILDTLIEGETATSVGGETATLLLAADGTLTASTGCRSVTGEWLETGGSITVPVMSAEGECPDDLWKQDSLVITVLEGDFRATVDGDRLTLTSMGGDGLVYHAG